MRTLIVIWTLCCVSSSAWAMPSELMRAYKKEFAFLHAQKRALKKRLRSFDADAKKRISRAQRDVKALQGKLLWTQNQIEKLREQLSQTERVTTHIADKADRLDRTFDQAQYTLEQAGIKLKAPVFKKNTSEAERSKQRAAHLEALFRHSITLMRGGAKLRKEKGIFFLQNGTRVKGDIIRIGHIASYGIGGGVKGALAPAGANRLKIWHQDASSTATALASQNPPKKMKIFLYESLRKEIKAKVEKTWLDIIQSGGSIAWVIVGLGLFAMLLIIIRTLILVLSASRTDALLKKVEPLVSSGRYDDAVEACRGYRGATARVLASAIGIFQSGRSRAEDAISEAILKETPLIERFASMITVCAAVAPLLGLLGTVTGMIATFDIITTHGTGDPKLLAGGISEALVTTELGLIVAIPTLLLGSLLAGRAESILGNMEWAALRLLNVAFTKAPGREFPTSNPMMGEEFQGFPLDERENIIAGQV